MYSQMNLKRLLLIRGREDKREGGGGGFSSPKLITEGAGLHQLKASFFFLMFYISTICIILGPGSNIRKIPS